MGSSAIGTFDVPDTGWNVTGVADKKLGFALADLTHDDHWFADSIRVERIAVAAFSDQPGAKRQRSDANIVVFGLGDCQEVQAPQLTKLPTGTTDPLGYYAPRAKAEAKYRLAKVFGEPDQSLEFDLAYLFTAYNKDASHEPGGVIPAARIYPTLTFRVPDVTHKVKRLDYPRIAAVQALFRLNLRLDDMGIGNQCGIFADLENMGPAGGIISAASRIGRANRAGSLTFLLAEKPVPFEVVGRGIAHGSTGGWDNTIQGWDNIHQWAHDSIPGFDPADQGFKGQPYTPGLPWGGHLHWRWGAQAATGAFKLPGGKQYGGAAGPGTPLIDDRIRDQHLEFAIVDGRPVGWLAPDGSAKVVGAVDKSPARYLFRDFSELWQSLKLQPDSLLPSSNLLIWLSITAWGPAWKLGEPDYREFYPGSCVSPDIPGVEHGVRYFMSEWGGTLFPHGIFFPHESTSALDWTPVKHIPGNTKVQYLPDTPTPVWKRRNTKP